MKVLLLATGGTIASKVQPDGGVAVALTGSQLVATLPELDASDIDVFDVLHGASWNFDLPTMVSIAEHVHDALVDGTAEAVVVTHGTDTLEETLWLTDLVAGHLSDRHAIVFTAAMRNAGQPDADGPRNLHEALRLARSPEGCGRGALLCVSGEVHEARWVTKTDAHALDTFKSFGQRLWTRPRGITKIEPDVAIVRSYGGIDGDIVDWHVARGTQGLIIEGGGAGNVAGTLVPGIERAIASGVPVVVVTRCLRGGVAPIYGGSGGGHSLESIGVIGGSDLNAGKARIALAVAMGVDPSVEAVRAWFEALG